MRNKKTRYAVMQLDTRNGWALFVSTPTGSTLVHNPLKMLSFTEAEADRIVAGLKERLAGYAPALLGVVCISKLQLD